MFRSIILIGALAGLMFFYGCQLSELTSAKVYMQEKNWEKALEQTKLATVKQPTNAQAWLLMGRVYVEMDSAISTVKAIDRALYLDPNVKNEADEIRGAIWSKYFNKGVNAGKKNSFENAVDFTLIAYRIDSTKVEAVKNLAFFYRKLNKEDDAIKYSLKAHELEPKNEVMAMDLASLYINNKQTGKAIPILQTLIKDKPQFPDAYRALGIAYANIQKLDSAVIAFDGFLKLDPKNENVLFEQGALLYEVGQKDSAYKMFERVLEINQENSRVMFNLSVIDMDKGNNEQAKSRLETIVNKEPKNYKAWEKLAQIYLKLGDVKKANASYKYAEGLVYLEDMNSDEALKSFEKSVELDSTFQPAWNELNTLYTEKNIPVDKQKKPKK